MEYDRYNNKFLKLLEKDIICLTNNNPQETKIDTLHVASTLT